MKKRLLLKKAKSQENSDITEDVRKKIRHLPNKALFIIRQKLFCPFHLGIVDNIPGRTLLDNIAFIHKDGIVGHISGKRHFMGDDYHRGFLFGKLPDDLEYFSGKLRIQSRGWLVEAQNVGI